MTNTATTEHTCHGETFCGKPRAAAQADCAACNPPANGHRRNTVEHTRLCGMTGEQLTAIERRGGWEPAEQRTAAAELRAGTHPYAAALTAAGGLEAAARSLEQAADHSERNAATATEILIGRRQRYAATYNASLGYQRGRFDRN